MLTMGSLFDGISGFPLAGLLNGVETKWVSEIEPFCIKVSSARFPNAKQLGSVTDINGSDIEPVDIITFGEGWWIDADVPTENIKCVFSADKDA